MPELNTDYGVDLLGKVTKGVALRNLLTENAMNENRLANMPTEIANKNILTGQQITENEQKKEAGALSLENEKLLAPLKKEITIREYLQKAGENITLGNYEQSRQHIIDTLKPYGYTVPLKSLVDLSAEATPEKPLNKVFEEYRTNELISNNQKLNELKLKNDTMEAEAKKTAAEVRATPLEQKPFYDKDGKTVLINMKDPNAQKMVDALQLTDVKPNKEMSEFQKISIEDRKSAREERLAQSKQFHDENLAFRQTMFDMNKEIKSRLPAAKAQELGSKSQTLSRYSNLSDSFKDSFGGSMVGGPTMTEIYTRTGSNKDRVNWWKNFKQLDVQIRHALFGATLTENEQKAWDAVTVSENSNPEVIKQAIQSRAKIAKEALEREVDNYESAGYNVSKFTGEKPGSKKSKTAVMDKLRKANPGTSDKELETYAKKKGYL